jgi:predicted RNA-binding protein
MNYIKIDGENVSVKEIFNHYEKYEDKVRRVDMEKEWVKEIYEKDKWKYIM